MSTFGWHCLHGQASRDRAIACLIAPVSCCWPMTVDVGEEAVLHLLIRLRVYRARLRFGARRPRLHGHERVIHQRALLDHEILLLQLASQFGMQRLGKPTFRQAVAESADLWLRPLVHPSL